MQASSCNPCKMVFRRAVNSKKPPKSCNPGECPQRCLIAEFKQKCPRRKFYECINANMRIASFDIYSNKFKLIQDLMSSDAERQKIFYTCHVTADLNFEEMLDPKLVKLCKKEMDVVFTSHDWVAIEAFTTLEFMKRIHFVKMLNADEANLILKHSFFTLSIVFMAGRSYFDKKEFMVFPGKVDVFPEEISDQYPLDLLNRIRCRLISKFIELRITTEEFLLMVITYFCQICKLHNTFQYYSDTKYSDFVPNKLCLVSLRQILYKIQNGVCL